LGARVRARRQELGMSQERLADLLGVTFQQVQKYEKGINRIAASRLVPLCAALETSLSRLFDGVGGSPGAKKANAAIDEALTKPGSVELVLMYAAIESPKVRKRVLELVRAMSRDSETG
jgi:transcriptional regulator with XRE-family HTH domain